MHGAGTKQPQAKAAERLLEVRVGQELARQAPIAFFCCRHAPPLHHLAPPFGVEWCSLPRLDSILGYSLGMGFSAVEPASALLLGVLGRTGAHSVRQVRGR